MLEEILEGLLEGWISSRGTSKRLGLVFRVFFGLLGLGLSVAGIYHMMRYDAGLHFRLAAAASLFFLACFCVFNVTLLSKWRWPGRFFVLSFVVLFMVRILFGP